MPGRGHICLVVARMVVLLVESLYYIDHITMDPIEEG